MFTPQLAVWPIIVGIVLSALGMIPSASMQQFGLIVRRIPDLGFEAIYWVVEYLVLGATVGGR